MMTSVTFDTFELDLKVTKIPAQKGGWDEPSYPEYYEIEEIFYKGIEVSELLEELSSDYYEIIQEQLKDQL